MIGTVKHIWRHPIKSHGREALQMVGLTAGATMPWDRTWAIAHEAARTDGTNWAPCANFSRGSKAPRLMAIDAQLNEASEQITLSHPDQPAITLNPNRDAQKLLDWVRPLMPTNRAQSARVIRVPKRGMTDTDYPSISINSLTSHRAVANQLGHDISIKRWRGNIWLDDLPLWEEFKWIGKTLRIGAAEIEIQEPITRCLATAANPETGERDADTLAALRHFGHQEFGIYGIVTKSGQILLGDQARLL